MDKTPLEGIALYKTGLPAAKLDTLAFAFTDDAILLLLRHEFEVDVPKLNVHYKKQYLDAESWQYAMGLTTLPEEKLHPAYLKRLTDKLYDAVRPLEPSHLLPDESKRLVEELKTLIVLHAIRYPHHVPYLADIFDTSQGLKRFFNTWVAQAVFKADGAKVLFGSQSDYAQLWLEKRHQLYRYAKYSGKYVLKLPA